MECTATFYRGIGTFFHKGNGVSGGRYRSLFVNNKSTAFTLL